MLDDLRRLRGLQLLQRQALVDADGERLTALDLERTTLQSRLIPLRDAGLSGGDLAEAQALVDLITHDQRSLVEMAVATRDRLAAELRDIGSGKAALAGYRTPDADHSRFLDSTR